MDGSGEIVGELEGEAEGSKVSDGSRVGDVDGEFVGSKLGAEDSVGVIVIVGRGLFVGTGDGSKDTEGAGDGSRVDGMNDPGSNIAGRAVGELGEIGASAGEFSSSPPALIVSSTAILEGSGVGDGVIRESITSAISSSSAVTPAGSVTSIVDRPSSEVSVPGASV